MQGPIRSILGRFALLGCLVASAEAQTLTRLQAPGGVQNFDKYVRIDRFLPGDRHALLSLVDGLIPGDTNGAMDAATYDLWTGQYALLLPSIGGAPPDSDTWVNCASADGNFVTLQSWATNLGFPDTNDVSDGYLFERATGVLQRVSLGQGGVEPNEWSSCGEVSDDGRWVVFYSEGNNVLPGDLNDEGDVFVKDMQTGAVELVSVSTSGGFGNGWSQPGEMSADGRFVLFTSFADDLVPGDLNGCRDLFLRDRLQGTTTRLNLGAGGVEADGGIETLALMTPDARFVAFDTTAANLHPNANGRESVFVLDRLLGTLTLGSEGFGGVPANGASYLTGLSDDGRTLAFMSSASNIDPSDVTYYYDEFHSDAATGVARIVTKSTGGSQGTPPLGYGPNLSLGRLSPSGRLGSFRSNLRGLAPADSNLEDVFLHDALSTCGPIASYCTAKVSAQGCTPVIDSGGDPWTSGPHEAFFVSARQVPSHRPGMLLWSLAPNAVPFYGGTLCLAGPVWRTPSQDSGGPPNVYACIGVYSFRLDHAQMAARGIGPGFVLFAQYWFRDGGPAPNNVGLTGGLRFVTGT